jgi:hypothetical protein
MNDVSEEPSVKFIRLNNGDDIIAEVVEVGDDTQTDYMVINPLKVVYIPSQRGSSYLQVAFMPWVFTKICEEQEFLIHSDDIITIGNVSEYMLEYYWKNMDYFITSEDSTVVSEEKPEPEETEPEETSLEELLEAIKSSRRTFH